MPMPYHGRRQSRLACLNGNETADDLVGHQWNGDQYEGQVDGFLASSRNGARCELANTHHGGRC